MKLAVMFPGIGYHADKPLLYYTKKLVKAFGYETIDLVYSDMPQNVKGSPEKMKEAFQRALSLAEEQLKAVDFSQYESLLFVSKSVGTAVSCAYAGEHGLDAAQILYTPVEETFSFMERDGEAAGSSLCKAVFHGTADPWAKTERIVRECQERSIPFYITEGANHSLETGDVQTDLENMRLIMKQVKDLLEALPDCEKAAMTEGCFADQKKETAKEASGMDSFLVRNTTRAQREQIVRESLGYSEIGCDDWGDGYEMYLPYIEGKKELKEITMEYQARYIKDMDLEERGGCGMR